MEEKSLIEPLTRTVKVNENDNRKVSTYTSAAVAILTQPSLTSPDWRQNGKTMGTITLMKRVLLVVGYPLHR